MTAQEFAHRAKGYAFLVLLNACEAATSLATSVSNLAYTLVMEGLPYALGMQYSVPDVAALKLTRFFYYFLARGHSVEEAVRQARIALAASDDLADVNDYVMGIPVLYTSVVRGFARFRVELGMAEIQETRVRLEFDTEITEAATFRGRRQELADIGRRLQEGAKVLTLVGPGGSGKSALAREAASRFTRCYEAIQASISATVTPQRRTVLAMAKNYGGFSSDMSDAALDKLGITTFVELIPLADYLVANDLMVRQEYEGGVRYAVADIAEKAAES